MQQSAKVRLLGKLVPPIGQKLGIRSEAEPISALANAPLMRPLFRAILVARNHLLDGATGGIEPRGHERHGNMVDLLITNIKIRRMDRVVLAARSIAEIGCRS
jgi:hypothetical protein